MTALRKSAKGRDCTVRIPGICNFDSDTTVLAHLGGGGMGMKRNDLFGAFCCHACHQVIDGAVPSIISKSTLKLYHLEGMVRTQEIWLAEGKIKTC
jgi:Protein of unknown function (DUF1364)